MHWFESEVSDLIILAKKYIKHRAIQNDGAIAFERQSDTHRGEFVAALNEVVANIASHQGITSCLISLDGLVMAMAGEEKSDFDALAAVTQEYVVSAKKGAQMLSLGDVQQTVVIGSDHKMAIVIIGEMALSVLSPRSTHLATTLSEDPKV
jgi:predicted regulator of Ras-like GTPase activity (Roadblock/LC7/MglB family)